MDAYSTILLGSMIVVAGGAISAIVATMAGRQSPAQARRWWWRVLITAVTALALVIVATVVHVVWDHPPGTEQALRAAAFLGQHPVIPVMAILAGGLMGWSARRLR